MPVVPYSLSYKAYALTPQVAVAQELVVVEAVVVVDLVVVVEAAMVVVVLYLVSMVQLPGMTYLKAVCDVELEGGIRGFDSQNSLIDLEQSLKITSLVPARSGPEGS